MRRKLRRSRVPLRARQVVGQVAGVVAHVQPAEVLDQRDGVGVRCHPWQDAEGSVIEQPTQTAQNACDASAVDRGRRLVGG